MTSNGYCGRDISGGEQALSINALKDCICSSFNLNESNPYLPKRRLNGVFVLLKSCMRRM